MLGVGTPVGILGGLYLGGTKEENTGAVIDLLGSLALLLNSARGFLEQLLGPREQVANPLLRQILGLFDRLAGLVPHLLGFVAIVVTRIGPLLVPLASQVKAFQALIASVVDTLGVIAQDLYDRVMEFLDPQYSAWHLLEVVMDAFIRLFPAIIAIMSEFFDKATDALIGIFHALIGESVKPRPGLAGLIDLFKILVLGADRQTGFRGLIERSTKWLTTAIDSNPLTLKMEAAKNAFAVAQASLSKGGGSSSSFPTLKLPSVADVTKDLGGEPVLGFGDIRELGELNLGFLHKLVGSPPQLTPEAQKQLDRARHPASVFAAERESLRQSLGGRTPKKALADQLAAQQQLRNLLTEVVGRILPPEIRPYMESLVGGFASLDQKIYGVKKKLEGNEYPVRDLPDNGLLRPVVHRLILRAEGGSEIDVQDFGDRVRKALLGQAYPATVAA